MEEQKEKKKRFKRELYYTTDRDNWFYSDFETTTDQTEYFKQTGDSRVILAGLQPFNKPDRDIEVFVSIEDYFKRLFSDGTNKTIWFHNLGWDGDFIIKYLINELNYELVNTKTRRYNTINIFKQGSRLYYIMVNYKYNNHSRKIIFRCSWLLTNTSISQLGKDLGYSKYLAGEKEDVNFYNKEPVDNINKMCPKFVDYMKRDIIIGNTAINQINNALNECDIIKNYNENRRNKNKSEFRYINNLTASGASYEIMKIYLYNYNKKQRRKNRVKRQMKALDKQIISRAYHGGWTQFNEEYFGEPQDIGTGMCFDINSSYPYQMTQRLPYGEVMETQENDDDQCFIWVKVKSAKIREKYYNLVCLQNFNGLDKKQRYTRESGCFETVYVKEEWDFLNKIYDFELEEYKLYYMRTAPFLKDMMEEIYHYKEYYKTNNQKAYASAFKIVMNSLYGRFCMRDKFNSMLYFKDGIGADEEIVLNKSPLKRVNDSVVNDIGRYKAIMYRPVKDKTKVENIGAAAVITSKARLKLWDFILQMGLENFLYSDTDSVFTKITDKNKDSYKKLCGTKLGEWDIESSKSLKGVYSFKYFGTYGAKKYVCLDENELTFKSGLSGLDLTYEEAKINGLKFDEEFSVVSNACLKRESVKSGVILRRIDKKFTHGKI